MGRDFKNADSTQLAHYYYTDMCFLLAKQTKRYMFLNLLHSKSQSKNNIVALSNINIC